MTRFPMRYFRSSQAIYEEVGRTVDAAWGLPANGQVTALPLPSDCPVVGALVYLSVRADHCGYEPISTILPQLLEAGGVEEVDAATYLEAAATLPLPPAE